MGYISLPYLAFQAGELEKPENYANQLIVKGAPDKTLPRASIVLELIRVANQDISGAVAFLRESYSRAGASRPKAWMTTEAIQLLQSLIDCGVVEPVVEFLGNC